MLNELENFIRNNKEAFDSELPSNFVWQGIEKKILGKDESKIASITSLEKNITVNKTDFDTEEPSAKVWENIAANVLPKKQAKVFTLKDVYKWSAAAAVFFIAVTSAYFMFIHKKPEVINAGEIVNVVNPPINSNKKIDTLKNDEELGSIKTEDFAIKAEQPTIERPDDRDKVTNAKEDASSDMFKIIQAKQAELKELTKEQPYLYKEFAADLNTLESSYGVLKKQLKQSPNTDVIIKAMMQNLQLQAELLGRQLTIINNIKKDRKNEKVNSHFN